MNNTIVIDSEEKVDKLDFDDGETSTIDLTEIIDYDKQSKVAKMVSGVEAFLTTGKLDAATALYLNVPQKSTSMDPLGSSYNARFGGEGFFSTALKMLENGILAVIRFIKKIVIWAVDKIKVLFGFGPSERQATAIAEKLPELKTQMKTWLVALGFPAHVVDLDHFLENMPNARSNDQIKFMVSKLADKEEYINRFNEIPPLIFNVQKVIGNGARRAAVSKKKFQDKLNKLSTQPKNNPVDWEQQGGELRELMLETIRALNYKEIIPELNKLLEIVIQQTIPDSDDGFSKVSIEIAEKITSTITTATVLGNKEFLVKIEQILTKTTVENLDRLNSAKSDMTDSMRALYDMVDASELAKISAITQLSGDNRYLGFYKEMAEATNVYTNFTKALVEIMRISSNTFSSLGGWYKETANFMLACVKNDVEKVSQIMLSAQQRAIKEGKPFNVDMYPNGLPKLIMVPEAEAQGFMEKFADVSELVVSANLLNIKNALNNFAKDTGGSKFL